MGLFEHFPYTNFHELNLDWLLKNQKEIDGNMSDLQDQMNSINNTISSTVQNTLQQWLNDGTLDALATGDVRKQNVIIYGDSYCTTFGGITTFAELIANSGTFETCQVAGAGGYGFATPTERNFLTLLNDTQVDDPDSINLVVVFGGYNDRIFTSDNVETGISSFMTAAKQKFKNANFMIGMVGWGKDSSQFAGLRNALEGYKSCSKYGAKYIDGIEYTLRNYGTDFRDDNIHPSQIGMNKLFKYALQGIIDGSCHPTVPFNNMGFSAVEGAPPISFNSYCDGNLACITSTGGLFMNNISGITFTGSPSDWHTIGSLSGGCVLGDINTYQNISVPCWLRDTGAGYTLVAANIRFNNGNVDMAISNLQTTGGNYVPITPQAYVFPAFTYTFSSLYN